MLERRRARKEENECRGKDGNAEFSEDVVGE